MKGQSGNPNGRPKTRRPANSAFDIIFDKRLNVSRGDVTQELAIDEVLQLKTYQDALKGNRPAIRAVLKMIEKREASIAKRSPPPIHKPMTWTIENDSRTADPAMLLLGIAERDPRWPDEMSYGPRIKLATWATQAAISRPGRRRLGDRHIEDVERSTMNPGELRWPRGGKR